MMKTLPDMARIAIIVLHVLWINTLMAQTITGRVLEAGTNKPIRNASIYFDGTLNGTTSDSTGSFTLYPQANRKVPVIVSAIGYETETIADFPTGKKVIVYLNVRQYDLEAVTINASDGMSRKEKLSIFRREFLGTSVNARNCEILNEDDIRITYTKKTKTIKAFSEKPIVVRNKNLGYTINFLPVNISFSPERIVVQGYQFFEEDPAQAGHAEIQKARQAAYLGSQIHFVRSLWNNELKKNGFNIYQGSQPSTYANTRFLLQSAKSHMLTYDSIVNIHNNDKYIHLEGGPVHIEYKGRTSLLNKIDSGVDGLINNNGYSDPSALIWSGLIGSQRIGDALPLEYNMSGLPAPAPEPVIDSGVKEIVTSVDTLRSRMPAEKLYIQFDKPYYSTGDTLRMKAYLFDAGLLKGSVKSGIVYIELANDTNKVLFRRMLPVGYGLGTGNIILNKEDIPEGSYTIRAYTNLMRNFGEDLVFKKNFYISGSTTQNWLVNSKIILSKQSGKDNLRLGLQLSQLNKKSLGLHDLDLRIMNGKRVLQRDKVQTDVDGKLDVNFSLPEKMERNNLSLLMADTKDANHKITMPIPVSRDENIDLQFMPEGGNLVAGILSVVGFKAIAEDGKGVIINGKVFNSEGEVTAFNSSYNGMGSFELSPKNGESYTARITLADGSVKSFPLPVVKSNGTALRIINSAESGSIIVTISSTLSTVSPNTSYYLTGQSRGIICYGALIRFNTGATVTKKVDKSLFPTGIIRFTLMNADKQPLNERITFVNHHDELDIEIIPNNVSYQKRDSIALAIEVKDQDGNPVQGSFSLAVTDDSQIKTDSLGSNVLTSLLLTSDLKGTVEDPMHYFETTKQAVSDLDHLLLTQGWTGYAWKDVFNPTVPQFAADSEFVVRGRIINVLNKGVSSAPVQLLSLKPAATKVSIAGKDGSFRFAGLPIADSLQFFIQAKNKNGKDFNVGIEIDEFKPPVFMASTQRIIPWYVNSDTTLLRQVNTQIAREKILNPKGSNLLESVTITGKKIIRDSKNLNGPGESDQALDEKDMAKSPHKLLLDVMYEKIKGFNIGIWPSRNPPPVGLTGGKATFGMPFRKMMSYRIFDKEVHLVIDGTDVESLYFPAIPPPLEITGRYIEDRNNAIANDRLYFIESFLTGITAEDVTGVEVMSDPRYNSRYKSAYASEAAGSLSIITTDFAYVEVTTRSGNGAYMKQPTGVYLYKPMPYVNSAAFYRPKYVVKTNPLSDFRSTIHWEPDILTDKEGKAVVSFYSADQPGTYSIIMEGSDMNGSIGRKTGTITVK